MVRGQRRVETLEFRVGSRLVGLRQQVVTKKKIGFVFINVAMEATPLGDFKARGDPYEFALPERVIPANPLVKGRYQIKVSYIADNIDDMVLEVPVREITIV